MHAVTKSEGFKYPNCFSVGVATHGILNGIAHHQSTAGFTEIPTAPENVTVGQVIVFRCRHASADTISWMFDSSLIGSNPPSGITVDYTRDMDGNLVYTLRVVALVQYNLTVIECVASVLNATTQLYDHKTTPPIVLVIKGKQTCLHIPVVHTFLFP